MIVRQFATRHGRSALFLSTQCIKRTYATEINLQHPAFRPSTNDHKTEQIISGQSSDPSSILDQTHLPPTRASREAAQRLADLTHETSTLQGDLNAIIAAKASQETTPSFEDASEEISTNAKANSKRLDGFYDSKREQRKLSKLGSQQKDVYDPWEIVNNPPNPNDVTLPMLLANQTHLGHATSLWNPSNSQYIFGIREGIHIISLEITLAYLRRAAKIVRAVALRGGIIVFVGTRKGQREIVINSAKLASGYHIFDRWIGGILTNGQQILGNCAVKVVNKLDREIEDYREVLRTSDLPAMRPDLVICLNPLENEVCLHECGLYNVPTIGVIDTDSNPTRVTYPIPANDDSLRSIALIAGVLGRAAQEGQLQRREAAKRGELTYDTTLLINKLNLVEESPTERNQPSSRRSERRGQDNSQSGRDLPRSNVTGRVVDVETGS